MKTGRQRVRARSAVSGLLLVAVTTREFNRPGSCGQPGAGGKAIVRWLNSRLNSVG